MLRAPKTWVFCLFLGAMTAAVYAPVAGYSFVHFDDNRYVTQNELVQRGLTWDGARRVFTERSPEGWPHPAAYLSHMLDVDLYGMKAGGHHLTNVLLHIAAAILLFLALLRMTAEPWKSAFVAAVFALHPWQVESVAWVAERKSVLGGFFFMLALRLYAGYARKPSKARYAGVLAAFALSLMSKAVAIGFPLILLCLDYWPLKRREPWKKLLLEKAPLLALSALDAVLVLNMADSMSPSWAVPLSQRLAGTVTSLCAYLLKTLWPSGLCVFYPFERGIAPWRIAGSTLGLAAITAACVLGGKRRPWLLVGWLWFLIAVAPCSGLVQVGAQSMADRYMYLPLVGLAVMAAWGVPARLGERARVLGSGGIVAALMIASSLQVRHWENGVTLFLRALRFQPESALVHDNLAAAFYEHGDVDDAVGEYRAGLALDPRPGEARNNLAIALVVQGHPDQAERELSALTAAEPLNEKARHNLERVRAILAEARAARRRPPRRSRRRRR